MKVTLSFEKTSSSDVSIMVDALRASTTITMALNNFKRIIPCFTPKEAFELKEKYDAVIAGERNGKQIEGFDLGNSPQLARDYKTEKDTLILTTSNGTRILKNMTSTVLVGGIVNAKSVADAGCRIAESHIDVVMAGYKGDFADEDFLAAGEILHWISKNLNDDCDISHYAQSAINESRDYDALKERFLNCNSAIYLKELNYEKDIEYCLLKNVTENVAIYENGELKLISKKD